MGLITLVPISLDGIPGEPKAVGPEPAAATDGFVAADTDFEYPNDGRTELVIRNGHATLPTTITFVPPNKEFNGVVYTPAATIGGVAAALKQTVFTALPTGLNNSTGKIVGTISSLTTVFVAAVRR
jgi:hypothetical protein